MRGFKTKNQSTSAAKKEEEKKIALPGISWLDFQKFRDSHKRYVTLRMFRGLLYTAMTLCAMVVVLAIYKLSNGSISSYKCNEIIAPSILCIIIAFLLHLLSRSFHSPVVLKADKIETYRNKFRAVKRRKDGKIGIYELKKFRMKKVLPFMLDDIHCTPQNSYLCVLNGQYGLWSAESRSMTVPIEYDRVEAIRADCIMFGTGNFTDTFDYNGSRVLKRAHSMNSCK